MEKKEIKKERKKNGEEEILLSDRFKVGSSSKELISSNNNQNKDLIKYNDLKEQLKLNLKDDINNKIQRMKILYEIKQKKLYKYDNFNNFNEFIKSFVIAKTQAYLYLKVYEKVLEGVISIDKIKEVGFQGVYNHIQKNIPLESNKKNTDEIPIRILVKNKELYDFCKQDTKRLYFILEKIFINKRDILLELAYQYEEQKKKKNK